MANFKPLDMYGDWVNIPMQPDMPDELVRSEVKEILMEQIDALIPRHWVYRRCVQFKETQQMDTLEKQVAWLYRPSLEIIEAELQKIIRRLKRVLDPVLCRVEPSDDRAPWWYQVRINIGSPGERILSWIFTTKERAEAWIKRNGSIEC